MTKIAPERRRYLRYRNRFWRILRTCEKAIKRDYPLFGLAGIPTSDQAVIEEVIHSSRLLELIPNYTQTKRYWPKEGFRGFLKAFAPSNLDELALALALYRPGPLASGTAEVFLKNEHREILHPSLQIILGSTRGVIIFYEQIIEIVKKLAGLTTAEAIHLKKMVGTGNAAGTATCKSHFLQRILQRGFPLKAAERIFEQITEEGRCAFSRAWSYESMATLYKLAYLKVYFARELRSAARFVRRKPSEFT